MRIKFLLDWRVDHKNEKCFEVMALCYSDSSSNYGEDVDLYIYDLTKRCEEERASSLTLTSIQTVARTDEIPHVSIVVFGIEYTFTKDIGITSTFVPVN